MPSTPDVKNELVRVVSQQVGERMSELATVLRLAGGLHTISGRIALEAELHTPAIVQRVRACNLRLFLNLNFTISLQSTPVIHTTNSNLDSPDMTPLPL